MIHADQDPTLRYVKDERTVSPRAAGNAHGWPSPIAIGSERHLEELELCWRGVAEIKAGGMPVTALERQGLPTDPADFPPVLRQVIADEAEKMGVTFGFAYGAIVRMEPWLLMGQLMFQTVRMRGGETHHDYAYADRDRYPNNPDLVGVTGAEAELGNRVHRRFVDTFDAKNAIDYPRPWVCANMPDDVAAPLLTLFADPVVEAGAGHSEYPCGHPANAAEGQATVEDCMLADDAIFREVEILGRLVSQGRAASGLHLWGHVQITYDHVLTQNRIETRL